MSAYQYIPLRESKKNSQIQKIYATYINNEEQLPRIYEDFP